LIALVGGIQPKLLNLAEILSQFIGHRQQVILRRSKFDLNKAKERDHILEGLGKALAQIDKVIKTIKASKDRAQAQKKLMEKFELSQAQANAILEMKLSALAKLEREKILQELKEIQKLIKELSLIIKSPKRVKAIIKKDLEYYQKAFGNKRRTKVVSGDVQSFAPEDLIANEAAVISLTQNGFIKRIKPSVYRLQKRGGKGVLGQRIGAEDVVKRLIFAQTHDDILFFTDLGRVFGF
jgi:DNA gyrase subunit A